MATKLKDVDAVVIGLGFSGAILSRELTKAGLNVVALERGADRNPAEEFTLTRLRDELRYVHLVCREGAPHLVTVLIRQLQGVAFDRSPTI